MERMKTLRRQLHGCPRLSGSEADTAAMLADFLQAHTTLEVHLEGNRLWCIHREPEADETVAFRADMDAIPAEDGTPFHGCGHDGHSAIFAGLGLWLEGKPVGKNVLLLFQDREETGAGAKPFCDSLLEREKIHRIYGFHNLPGWQTGCIVSRPGVFACASRGFAAHVRGSQAHAAYPEQGKNPAQVLSCAVLALNDLRQEIGYAGLLMATVVGLQVGGENFGVSAGEGTLCLTLRSESLDALEEYQRAIEKFLRGRCAELGMEVTFAIRDAFPDTVNDDGLLARARRQWEAKKLPQQTLEEPMRWSEDFGWYLKRIPGMYFGIGAGVDAPGLHTPEYEFNDAILERGVEALAALL